jgi:hypothetical protein
MKSVILSLLFLLTHSAQANVQSHAALYPEITRFDLLRNGERVGDYWLEFQEEDAKLTVKIGMQLSIKVFGLFNYNYSYSATERWVEDELYSLDVRLNKNGDQQQRSWVSEKYHSLNTADVIDSGNLNSDLLPTHHWYSKILSQKRVFNTIKAKAVEIDPMLDEQFILNISGEKLLVNAYRLGGDLENTQSWYDTRGVWRGMRFKAKDGSNVEVIWQGAERLELSS